MPKTLTIKTYQTAELPSLGDLLARTFSALKSWAAFTGIAEVETPLNDRLQYDVGENDIRPSHSKPQPYDHQSLDAMLMRGF